jgi:SAM-dependent methyltransferase
MAKDPVAPRSAPSVSARASTPPPAIGSDELGYQAVLGRLRQALGGGGAVLDAPAGAGALTWRLVEAGYDVSAADIRPDLFALPQVECARCDLNRELPFESGRFAAVLSCNGIHHVHALGRCMAEYARVLAPGGSLLLSFPNFTSVSRRLRFFFSGNASRHATRYAAATDPEAGAFRHPVGLPQVLSALEAAGLEVVHLGGVRGRWWRFLYLPLVALIYAVGPLYLNRRRRLRYHWRRTHSWPALFADFLVLEARKPGPKG